mmetsp:Transcript_25307/g.33866  ORF Transcript_25307/g.33866 Transcript_25307/m.33866 type:complete len:135 (-) Transcript_25307:3654-4058(-)
MSHLSEAESSCESLFSGTAARFPARRALVGGGLDARRVLRQRRFAHLEHFLLSHIRRPLSHVGVPSEQIVAEADYLFALLAHSRRVAVVGDLDDGGGSGWGQQRLLELDLLEEQLVGFERRQLVLPLHAQEVIR